MIASFHFPFSMLFWELKCKIIIITLTYFKQVRIIENMIMVQIWLRYKSYDNGTKNLTNVLRYKNCDIGMKRLMWLKYVKNKHTKV